MNLLKDHENKENKHKSSGFALSNWFWVIRVTATWFVGFGSVLCIYWVWLNLIFENKKQEK